MAQKKDINIDKITSISKKVGTGGLPAATIEQANKLIDEHVVDTPYLKTQISALKNQIESDVFLQFNNHEILEDFLHDLLPLKVSCHYCNNDSLLAITSDLLSFIEKSTTLNIDAFHIIRAHVNGMKLVLEKEITKRNHPFSKALNQELSKARERYNHKYQTI